MMVAIMMVAIKLSRRIRSVTRSAAVIFHPISSVTAVIPTAPKPAPSGPAW
jgi:hypothetical protein